VTFSHYQIWMELKGTDILEYEIHVKQDARPSRQKPYNYSKKARAEIEKQVQELLSIKFIRRSTSAWCSNVLLVKKRDRSMMMCVDYRNLNSCIIPEVHPVTYKMIADMLSYAKPKIYSSLDLQSSFHNLRVAESSTKYIAFQTHIGQFKYLEVPYGVQNLPSALCLLMSLILSENTGPLMRFALVYLDDTLIFLSCIDRCSDHLREFFLKLQKSKIKINQSRCSFLVNKLIFLGNFITPYGIGPDPEKVSAMLQYPAPTDQKKCAAFWDYSNFIRSLYQDTVTWCKHLIDY